MICGLLAGFLVLQGAACGCQVCRNLGKLSWAVGQIVHEKCGKYLNYSIFCLMSGALVLCTCVFYSFIYLFIYLYYFINFFICDVRWGGDCFESQLSQIWLLIRYMKVIELGILIFIGCLLEPCIQIWLFQKIYMENIFYFWRFKKKIIEICHKKKF